MQRQVIVFAFDGVRLMDVAAPLEVFATASRDTGAYAVRVCTPGGRDVITSTGLRIVADLSAEQAEREQWPEVTLIVPGPADLETLRKEPALVDQVARLAAGAQRVAAVCTGAFALAAAGLLRGRRATTHWEHAAELARRHPDVQVTPDAIYVQDGKVLTSAGVTAGIDVCLAMVEQDHGPEAARRVARDLVVFLQRPGGQSQFSAASRTTVTAHPVVRPLLDAIAADPASDHSPQALAGQAGVSARHLSRLFREETGSTPAAYVETMRLEAARMLLERGESVTSAARRSGLGSDETLRRTFARHLGTTPSAYAARFRSTRPVVPRGPTAIVDLT
ncbi:GlxA family transcriptional regulator [Streptomyces sp. RKAG293]|uniref:GlxA family transcriptional regulator n=1 Tax=Streptomyces sp. RKAG293 TaxID=2893403 RepID=UPI0020346AF8|nr:DJ-1/PfpI family protein [Streptomyces sp. RKAG293]MCM2423485.1 DJ-1/PfpI family protein [Streptomyces sp. RKAG293]